MRGKLDLSVYFILDPSLCPSERIEDIVQRALDGGVRLLQLRNKKDPKSKIAEQARLLQPIARKFDVPLLINDHVDVAIDVNADGVHLGQGDLNPEKAREMLGSEKIIGLTAFTEEHMHKIASETVDYVGTGPFFETKTDKGKPVMGEVRFAEVIAHAPCRVVGIGGITPENAHEVIKAGADGVAMMRAVCEADDPKAAAQAFVSAVERTRQEAAV